MATWGVKVNDQLKEKITNAMRESGLEGQDFVEQLYTLYAAEVLKQEKPALAQELEELQKLTQRIYSIYLNAAERADNLLQAKEDNFQSIVNELQEQITAANAQMSSKEADFAELTEAFNNLMSDKKEVDTRVAELLDTVTTKQELVEQYKSKVDTLSGIIEEYKEYKKTNIELKNTLADKSEELLKSQNSIASLEDQRDALNERIEAIESNNKSKMQNIVETHKTQIEGIRANSELDKGKAILELERRHQQVLAELTEKFNSKTEQYSDKLEKERELNAALKEENIKLKTVKIPKVNKKVVGMMVKMRLEGLPEEVAALVTDLRTKDIEVLAESREYPNKGNSYVRVYLDIEI